MASIIIAADIFYCILNVLVYLTYQCILSYILFVLEITRLKQQWLICVATKVCWSSWYVCMHMTLKSNIQSAPFVEHCSVTQYGTTPRQDKTPHNYTTKYFILEHRKEEGLFLFVCL